MGDTLVGVADVHKRFGRTGLHALLDRKPSGGPPVLRGVNLQVEEGDFVALLGANGVGKTTLMKTIATLLLPDSGTVSVLGSDAVRDEKAVRANVGYVMADERSFHWRLDARQNLDFFARLDGISSSERASRIDYCYNVWTSRRHSVDPSDNSRRE